ncbi:GNAT family protein [Agrococcus sp. Marseille-Q4369]|uniref:GNAT family N-acetyltransferase n=1 Tax=Agrococcus sp. Marseille-Q4369 TaxID=2810513 RepID=UPI001B8AB185|nr:GNAT family protein [Agrococcus sp. Marseille-Q4369]QUW18964.1 GNAT family N-acetyltransferase [Agrococcus sp. Marseille-Q4369]
MQIDIRPAAPLPDAVDPRLDPASEPDDELRLAFELNERANAARFGDGLYTNTLAEFVALLRSDETERIHRLLAWCGERLAGVLTMYTTLIDSTDVADLGVQLDPALPALEQAAIAEALVARGIDEASALGRSTIVASTVGARIGGVSARTGHGAADPTHPEVAPLVARGFELEQVYRVSVADLSQLGDLEARHAAGLERASGYDLERWVGETPAEHREGMRMLHERMSVDAPVAGLAWEPETWDDARLAAFEQSKQGGGRSLLTVAARERASGQLAGFSTLILPTTGGVARQHDTLVTQPHRGHGLGMLLKLDNMLRLRELRPELTRIVTWNAEENRPMLAVNERCGFEPIAYEAQWQRKDAR